MAHVWTQQELKKQLFQDIIGYLHKGKVSLHGAASQVESSPSAVTPRAGDASHLWPCLTVPVSCLLVPQMWEKAIELGKQLAKMHESHMFDFMELSQLLVRSPAHQTVHAGTASLQELGAPNMVPLWSKTACLVRPAQG